jgi:hypothetical protein
MIPIPSANKVCSPIIAASPGVINSCNIPGLSPVNFLQKLYFLVVAGWQTCQAEGRLRGCDDHAAARAYRVRLNSVS